MQKKKDKTERARGIGRRTREEMEKLIQITALRFQTGGRRRWKDISRRNYPLCLSSCLCHTWLRHSQSQPSCPLFTNRKRTVVSQLSRQRRKKDGPELDPWSVDWRHISRISYQPTLFRLCHSWLRHSTPQLRAATAGISPFGIRSETDRWQMSSSVPIYDITNCDRDERDERTVNGASSMG